MRLFPRFRVRPMPASFAAAFLGAPEAIAASLEETRE
jgi:hypothetical protein